MSQVNEISFYGVPPAAGPIDGYSYAGLKIVTTLNKLGIDTPWRDEKSPFSVSFCQPDWYSQSENQYRIGYTPWESTKIPAHWVSHMNNMDWMWTTSGWCKQVLVDNGVTNDILVVPHGIDSKDWTISKRVKRNKFTFFHLGEPATRKNGQMVVDAFVKLFNRNPNVNLLIKANGYTETRLKDPFGPVTAHPRIKVITERLPIEQLNGLFHSVHCLVYPSNGEGFGLIPFQGIATGLPTILVNWSGVEEFGEYGIPIDYKVASSSHDYHIGEWAFPDFDSLCEQMEKVYIEYEDFSSQAYQNGLLLREKFGWRDILSRAVKELELRIKS